MFRSFRTKTALLPVLLSSLLLVTSGVLGWQWLQHKLQGFWEEQITLPGQRIAAYRSLNFDWSRFEETLDLAINEDWERDVIVQARSNFGERETLYQSENWPEDLVAQDIPGFEEARPEMRLVPRENPETYFRRPLLGPPHLYWINSQSDRWRMVTFTSPEITLYLGINHDEHISHIQYLRTIYFGALLVVIIGIAAGGYRIASQALKPVDVIADTARRITSRDLSQRIPPSRAYDTEFDSLIAIINEMMDRLEKSFQQAMRFTADASHELKTPLANLQNDIASRLQNCEPESEEQKTLNRLLEEVQRLKQILRSLFLLSQADAGTMPLTNEDYNFSEQIEAFAQDSELLAEEMGLTFETSIEPDLMIHGDELMIGQAVQNLISNAMKHNKGEGGFVRWTLRSENGQVVFSIENSGPAIDSEDQNRIFDRFYRGRNHRSQKSNGLGLGLSLAKEIVLAHRGSLKLIRSDDQSTCFELVVDRKERV
jgi:two-component system heavy metal sensor histidine kinase CusS